MTLLEELNEMLYHYDEDGNDWEQGVYCGICQVINIIKEHSDWIPASEQPQKEGEYNVTSKSFKETKTMYYSLSRNEWYYENGIYDNNDILAWQPLPKPYKEREK